MVLFFHALHNAHHVLSQSSGAEQERGALHTAKTNAQTKQQAGARDVHGEGLALIGICDGKGTQCQQAGNMHGALVKANSQDDEEVTMSRAILCCLAKNESAQQASRLIHCSTNSGEG